MSEILDGLDEREREEAELVFDSFDNDEAWELGIAISAKAREGKLPVAIDIEKSGQVLFHYGNSGSTPDIDGWIMRKRNVTKRFHRSSLAIFQKLSRDGESLDGKYALDPGEYAASGGSFPIRVKGSGCIGAVTVSGLPHTEDHALVVDAIRAILSVRKGRKSERLA